MNHTTPKNVRPWLFALAAIACIYATAFLNHRPAIAAEPQPAPDPAAAPLNLPATIDFNRDIRLILSDNCYACHGPDKNQRKADLRLDTKDGLFSKTKDDVLPVVPGKPDQSDLYRRITTADEEDHMPPKKSGKTLTPRQIALLKKWIEQGAPWKGHWAYLKPAKPAVETQQPKIENPIDFFIRAKLDETGLKPAPQADRITLARRLYFDLTGLPPTPADVDAFVNDPSDHAYENLVEKLLASPHYGERMAMYWLDLVRFADTIGYHSDNPHNVYPYRDWVIKSFNENKRFDQFTLEQLAGDLLPNATVEQKVASGYNRLLQTTEEGGAQAKEYIVKYAADRVRNYSSVWLGATMLCSECHDHKFDPFTQKDFYSLAAFFADIQEPIVGGREPGIPVMTPDQESQVKTFDTEIAAARKNLDANSPELSAAQAAWENSLLAQLSVPWTPLAPVSAVSKNGATLKTDKDNAILATGANPDKDTYTITLKTNLKSITALRLEALTDKSLPNKGPGRAANGNFVLQEISIQSKSATAAAPTPIPLRNASATFEQVGFAEANPDKKFSIASAIGAVKNSKYPGWAIMEQAGRDQHAVFETATPIGDGPETTLIITLKQDHGDRHTIGKFRLSATTAAPPIKASTDAIAPKNIADIVRIDPAKRTDPQKQTLAAHYRTITPLLEPARKQVAALEKQKIDFLNSLPKQIVSISGQPHMTRILPRGNWLVETGVAVEPATPHFLFQQPPAPPAPAPVPAANPAAPANPPTKRQTRLELAQWTISRENPLTSRVFVNRLWKLFYGTGLSKTLEDTGSQGEWPTHPELLDYLAVDFMESGWDIKRMVRQMVTSATYRQSSTPDLQIANRKLQIANQLDPFNRLYSHQSRWRLDAEIVRDNALSISGLLVHKIGGPSVKPYQPPGYWAYLNFPAREWANDAGEKQYRRGMYTWWQRSFLQPSLLNFDAPSREECAAERARSNTPQQALTLLNDTTYVEASRAFAARILKEGGNTTDARLTFAMRQAVQRNPRPAELQILTDLLDKHRAQFAADKPAAAKFLAVGFSQNPKDLDPADLAAWTNVARAILNLHETITRF